MADLDKVFSLRLDQKTLWQLEGLAKLMKVSRSELVRQFIELGKASIRGEVYTMEDGEPKRIYLA